MGYGYGRTTNHGNRTGEDSSGKRVGSVFSNDMVAHVWNSQRQSFGRSSNGNFYFEGPTLYSYGSHFPVAHIMPDGAALLNADSYSSTTSQHKSDANSAARNRPRYRVPSLRDLLPALVSFDTGSSDGRERAKREARQYVATHAEALARSPVVPSGSWEHGERTALAYLCDAFGFGRSAGKILRDAIAKREREAKESARAALARDKARAVELSGMPDSEWRNVLRINPENWNQAHNLKGLARDLFNFRRRAGELGLSDARKRRLWEREKRVRLVLNEWAERHAIASLRKHLRDAIKTVRRTLPDYNAGIPADAPARVLGNLWQDSRALSAGASIISGSGRVPFVSRRRLQIISDGAAAREGELLPLYQAAQSAERAAEEALRTATREEQKRSWLASESPRLFYRFDSDHGGAALRVYGEELQTSHGATVPLAHAVKAFRFLKLIRERGEEWKRNGKTIRVGHFQIDRIAPSGDFTAGCHDIRWPEVERIARALGVLDEAPSAEAEERTAA